MMGKSKHQPLLQTGLRMRPAFIVGLAAIVAFGAAVLPISRRPTSSQWTPYSTTVLAAHQANGKPTAVLYYARWALSADPKGGLCTTAVSRSLSDAGFVMLDADLTDSGVEDFAEFRKQGFDAVPVLVLYPTAGPRLAFDGGTPESEIVSTIERLSQ
jgi:thiol:disulfide interchange protein